MNTYNFLGSGQATTITFEYEW